MPWYKAIGPQLTMYLQSESEVMGQVITALKEKGLEVQHIYRADQEVADAVERAKQESTGLEEDQVIFFALHKLQNAAV